MIKKISIHSPALATGLLLFSVLLPTKAIASSFTTIYSFGDSLSDTHNVFDASGMTFPPSPPYFNGHFSNGQIWLEYLSEKLGLPNNPANNFAFGGATTVRDPITGVDNTIDPNLPGFQDEIGLFALTNPIADPNALYTIWTGANDYLPTMSPFFTPLTTPTETINNTLNAVQTLLGLGARKIAVVNLPDLGNLPLTNGTSEQARLNALTQSHNTTLFTALDNLTLPPDAEIIPVNVNQLFKNVVNNPGQFNFTNVTNPCLNQTTFQPCSNPDEYLFWDRTHPTTAAHKLIGELAFRQVITPQARTPEPGLVLGIITIGIIAVGGKLVKTNDKVQ